MSSNREATSVQRTSSEPAGPALAAVDKSLPIVGVEHYVPNVFDLVTPTHRTRDSVKLYIPPVFLQSEAVDSSLLLGKGASFVVTRQALPPGPAEIVERKDMGGWAVESLVKAPEQPRYVVYKSARVRFQPNGDPATPEDRRALQSVLTEFHVLLHPPLLHHQNIIDFLGLAWGSNHAEPLHQLPVLVIEYGDRGTLADVQRHGPPLPSALKKDVCLGIARGLDALHNHGIIHGDVKPDNIIMCSHKENIIVPKLADFGFAIIKATEMPTRKVMIGGTRTWRAPESFLPIPTPKLMLTDVYSFGLVAWSVAIDGQDPFNLVLPDSLQGEERLKEIDRLKAADEILFLSKLEKWCLYWRLQDRLREQLAQLQTKYSQNITDTQGVDSILTRLKQLLLSQQPDEEPSFEIPPILQQYVGAATSKLYQDFRTQVFFKDLDFLFSHTLSKDPDNRDLSAVIQLLESKEGDEIDR
jgi:serine/threonine protein kinase